MSEHIPPGYEHTVLKGMTVKNMLVTIFCTATIVSSVMATYFTGKQDSEIRYNNLNSAIAELKFGQDKQNLLYDVRLKALEAQVQIIQQQISELQKHQK